MYPQRTMYYEATALHMPILEHFRATATDASPHAWPGLPVVYAVRDGAILGYLGQKEDTAWVILGPLVLRNTVPRSAQVLTGLRLWQAMETVLRRYGVTQYVFSVDGHDTRYEDYLLRWGFQCVGWTTLEGHPYAWYASRGVEHTQGLLTREESYEHTVSTQA